MKNIRQKIKNNQAFSMIEVIVAVGIISVGMMGVLSLLTQNIQVQVINKNNLIASMLAQEGLELVRQIRDSNWLVTSLDYSDGFGDNTIIIDPINTLNDTPDSIDESATELKIDINGFYTHDGTISTPFKRLIYVSSTTPDFINVKSTVRWSKNGKDYDYVAETLLYDWR